MPTIDGENKVLEKYIFVLFLNEKKTHDSDNETTFKSSHYWLYWIINSFFVVVILLFGWQNAIKNASKIE